MGFEGQARIAEACVVVAGSDLACEVAARSLSAGGVGRLRLVRDGSSSARAPGYEAALLASNPELGLEIVGWPERGDDEARAAWRERLAEAAALVMAAPGPDGDSLLQAARELGVPVVSMDSGGGGIAVVSSYREPGSPGPSAGGDPAPPRTPPATALDASPARTPTHVPMAVNADALAVVAGHLAATEVLVVLAGAASRSSSRARGIHLALPGATADLGGATPEGTRASSPRRGIQPAALPDER